MGLKHEACSYHTMEVAASPDTITSTPTYLYGFEVETNQTADVTIVLSDGATEVITYIVTGTTDSFIHVFPVPVEFTSGITVSLAGVASRCVVFYKEKNF